MKPRVMSAVIALALALGLAATASAQAPSADVDPRKIDFGTVDVGGIGPPRTLTLTNDGSAPLTVADVSKSGSMRSDFLIVDDDCSDETLAPTQSCEIVLRFAPTDIAVRSATLEIETNAQGSPHTAQLTGVGADPDTGCMFEGTSASETVTGTRGDDVICGLGGDDVLKGFQGDDRLLGGEGADVLQGRQGDDALEGQAGRDFLNGGADADTFAGGTDEDTAYYGDRTAAVNVSAGAFANDGETGENDDVKADIERLVGGTGGDTLRAATGTPTVLRGGEWRRLAVRRKLPATCWLAAPGPTLTRAVAEPTPRTTAIAWFPSTSRSARGPTTAPRAKATTCKADIERVVGGSGADDLRVLASDSIARVLCGRGGADTLVAAQAVTASSAAREPTRCSSAGGRR